MSRVVSKHLFNYPLHGVMPKEVEMMLARMKAQAELDSEGKTLKEQVDSDDPTVDPEVAAKIARRFMPAMMARLNACFKDSIDRCIQTEFKVPIRDGNDYEVPVYVHTPPGLANGVMNAAIIYAHGGGCVAGEALQFKGVLSNQAIEIGAVIFNVDYRIAPETKFPKNALDFYCAVKHVIENADSLNIDRSRIALAGDSGGGYICFATMMMLAEKDEGDLIKLAVPAVPMISDYSFNDLASMTQEEREIAHNMRKIWSCLAHDMESDRNNPLLFPAKANDEMLMKMPPTIIWEFEFDYYITETTRMAHRMRRAGRLLEFRVQPGMTHMSAFIPGTPGYEMNKNDLKLAYKEYLLS